MEKSKTNISISDVEKFIREASPDTLDKLVTIIKDTNKVLVSNAYTRDRIKKYYIESLDDEMWEMLISTQDFDEDYNESIKNFIEFNFEQDEADE